jgi:hypothetical protein
MKKPAREWDDRLNLVDLGALCRSIMRYVFSIRKNYVAKLQKFHHSPNTAGKILNYLFLNQFSILCLACMILIFSLNFVFIG